MEIMKRLPALAVLAVLIAGGSVVVWKLSGGAGAGESPTIRVPELSQLARQGQSVFEANCAQCHGTNGAGTDKGPPLVHDIYNPGHHPDEAFFRAVRQGVPRHHWSFGDMPLQPQVTDDGIAAIVRFVRELQQANGIRYRQHQM